MPDIVNKAADHVSASGATYADAKVFPVALNSGGERREPIGLQNDYNLFEQAIRQRIPEAWEQIQQVYAPLVQKWITYHPDFANTGADIDYFVNRAFEKMWDALTPEKFENFSELKPLLAYLQMCVNSVIIDHLRMEKRYSLTVERAEENPLFRVAPTQTHLRNEVECRHFWECIRQRLKNETEYKLLYYRFVLGIKPRQLCTEFGDTFPNVSVVDTLTQNILARLRRDSVLAACCHDPALMDLLN